jgi:aconitate hydratase
MANVETSVADVKKLYEALDDKFNRLRDKIGGPLTLAQKIFLSHLDDPEKQELVPGESYLALRPDRVAMQDATAQMAILQFMLAGKKRVQVSATAHADHLIVAEDGEAADLKNAKITNREVYDFIGSASKKFGIGFWGPGAGIIHQVVIENYAFPGGLMIGSDSHTPNAGGLGMAAIGVGGADATDVMAGLPWEVMYPKGIGVKLTGQLSGWTAPKDIILRMCDILTTKGGTNHIIEYIGSGAASISATGKATVCNMGAEVGATCSVFSMDQHIADYLRATNRPEIADLALEYAQHLQPDPEIVAAPEKHYNRVIEIDLSALEPYLVGPHTPDKARPISKMAEEVKAEGYPDKISYTLIGSCTNSSYEDIGRTAHVAKFALDNGIKMSSPFMVTPGSDQIFKTTERDGQLKILRELGASVLANACGPCIGQWKRKTDLPPEQANTILTSFNRNFKRRADGNPNTLAFIGSPELVTALGIAGSLSFNPATDEIETEDGRKLKLEPPQADALPAEGFVAAKEGYQAPVEDGADVEVIIPDDSERLQILQPFPAWSGEDFSDLRVLLKAEGKCTTDHISPAGPWLRFRGHLDNISNNAFLGASNMFAEEAGHGVNVANGERDKSLPEIARHYKNNGIPWLAVGDANYGEGSSREHAAMCPRYLGMLAVIARSFARIHETNLKKQGILTMTFADSADYDKIREDDAISVKGLAQLAPGQPLEVVIRHMDGDVETISANHSLTQEQIRWFKAGSALNLLRQG